MNNFFIKYIMNWLSTHHIDREVAISLYNKVKESHDFTVKGMQMEDIVIEAANLYRNSVPKVKHVPFSKLLAGDSGKEKEKEKPPGVRI